MSRTVITLNNPTFVLADTEAGLTTGEAYECQLTQAALVPTAVSNPVPGTGCAGPGNLPSPSTWAITIAWLQDWTAPGGGLSNYAVEHDAELVWFKFVLDVAGSPTTAATGQAYVKPGDYGGVFGGPPALATSSWDMEGKPTFTVPAVAAAAATSSPAQQDEAA